MTTLIHSSIGADASGPQAQAPQPLAGEFVALRDTAGQDRAIEPVSAWKRHRVLLIVGGGLAVAVVGLLSVSLGLFTAQASVARSRLTIATVERGTFVRDVAADGQVVAAVSPTMYASAAGTVSLKVNAGDPVTRGQILAVVESFELAARLSLDLATLESLRIEWQRAQLESDQKLQLVGDAVRQAEVDLRTAQREYERSLKAYEAGAYPQLQVLRAQDALEKAQFAFEQAQKNYESQPKVNRFDIGSKRAALDRQQLLVADLKRQVDALSVRSPVDGQIGQVHIADRASVAKDAPLLSVVDLSALEVEIKVAENLARDLRPGMTADLSSGGRHWEGQLRSVSPEVVSGRVTARVRLKQDKPAGLRQNQRLAVRVLIDRRENVVTVERGTFIDQGGGQFAYLVQGNIAQRRPISIGAASLSRVEILEGLQPGDRIVIAGTDAFDAAERVVLSE